MQVEPCERSNSCDYKKNASQCNHVTEDATVDVAKGLDVSVDRQCNGVSSGRNFPGPTQNCNAAELVAVDGSRDDSNHTDGQANEDSCVPVPSKQEAPTAKDFAQDLEQLIGTVREVSLDESVETEVKGEFDLLSKCSRNVFLKILGYLDLKDLVHNVSLVSRKWHSFAYDPALWSKVDLRGYVVNDIVMSKIPELCNFVHYVWLPDAYNEDFTDNGLKILAKGCPLLKTLIAPRCGEKFSDEAIIAFTEHCRKLKELYLDSLDITDLTLKNIAERLTELRILSLCQVSPITNQGVAEIFRSCRGLEQLFVNHNQQITDECFSGISDNSQSLRRLEVMMCNIQPSGVPAIGKLSNLEVLNLTQCTSLTAEHLIPVLKGCKRLYSLGLNLNKFIDDECVYLILTHLPGLRNIYLVSTTITDKALDVMGWKGKCLERVDLGYTKITESGARRVSEKCRTLNYLGLMRCDKIPESVVEELVVQYPHIMYSTFIQDAKRLLKRVGYEKGLEDEDEEEEEEKES